MRKLLALTTAGTLLLSVSCGYNDSAMNGNLNNAKTSAYSVTNQMGTDKTTYVPSTYSANRVKYYDGMYGDSSYVNGQSYMSDYGTTMSNTKKYSTNASGYKDVRNGKDSRYLTNSYVNTNPMYENSMYTDLSATDFNNGLVTYDHKADTTRKIDTTKLGTNAMNYNGVGNSGNKTVMTGVYGEQRNIDTTLMDNDNAVNYEVNNTYEEMKTATKDLVNDVTNDAKTAVYKAKVNTKGVMNEWDY